MGKARDIANLGGDTANLEDISAAYGAGALSNRNLIINGAMQVAQRGTSSTSSGFLIDRFNVQNVSDGAFSATQDTSAPVGFKNSLKITVTTADASLSSVQNLRCEYRIEGNDTAQLEWGTSDAKTVTLSFWVRSSLTGTFGGAINNSAFNRAYPFSYSISSADTWEYKTVTIDGDTSGTWLTDTGIGANVCWSLGAGSSRVGTAGAWASVNVQGVTGQVEVIGTLNATWQITGVQLEVGDTATPFEHRSYGQELALCQRYYYRIEQPIGGNANDGAFGTAAQYNSTLSFASVRFPVSVRAATTLSYSSLSNFQLVGASTGTTPTALATNANTRTTAELMITSSSFGTQGQANWIRVQSGGYIAFDAEL